ncbi:MAG TPA: hypothetical protein VK449_05380 [Anaerolineales bacterium]|nr:hypothetical protein [Anaerolineales bacterium]
MGQAQSFVTDLGQARSSLDPSKRVVLALLDQSGVEVLNGQMIVP